MACRMTNPGRKSVFYDSQLNQVTEVRAGYLVKSPPCSVMRREGCWRRRYFVLFKTSEVDYQLLYFNSAQDRDTPLGEINLKDVSLIYTKPEKHPRWRWVLKNNNKCDPSCVLYLKASPREFFLVGDNSWDVTEWYNALRCGLPGQEDNLYEVVDFHIEIEPEKPRSTSEPPLPPPNSDVESQQESQPRPTSEPVSQQDLYNYPKTYQKLKEPKDEFYMPMDKVDGDADPHTDDELMNTVPEDFVLPTTQTPNRKDTTAGEEFDISPTDSCDCSGEKKMLDRLEKHKSTKSLEQDVDVLRADLKEHLTMTDVDGRLCVSAWTGQPPGLFQEGDLVVALNDLLTCTTAEFHVYLSRILKNQVKLTILRQQRQDTPHRRRSL